MHEKTIILVDAHVHLYPSFDIEKAIRAGLDNFNRIAGDPSGEGIVRMWLLTERSDCHFFQKAMESPDRVLPPESAFYLQRGIDSLAVKNHHDDRTVLYILPGRQIVTNDGLEVCALGTTYYQQDRVQNTQSTIDLIRQHDGIASLNWAPGKWFFDRGKIVRKILEHNSPDTLLIGDTSMRPSFWRQPKLMTFAADKGFKIIAGSDPLPFAGEEKLISSYGSKILGIFDPDRPVEAIKSLLTNAGTSIAPFGKRSATFTFVSRQIKIMLEKRKRA